MMFLQIFGILSLLVVTVLSFLATFGGFHGAANGDTGEYTEGDFLRVAVVVLFVFLLSLSGLITLIMAVTGG